VSFTFWVRLSMPVVFWLMFVRLYGIFSSFCDSEYNVYDSEDYADGKGCEAQGY
jgi:hypothetical protein